jgi:hypothetical protein
MTGILISMCTCGIITGVTEEILGSMGKTTEAKWIKVGGVSLTVSLGLGLVFKTISQLRKGLGV